MKTKALFQIILLASLAASSVGAREWEWHEEITPETELRRAQRISREGTNLLARGMFREAEERIGGGIGTATGKLRELEQRAATVGPLQSFVDRLQAVRDRFDDDWTNAIGEAFALEAPIKSYVATNPVIQAELAWPLRTFDRLREELDSGNRRDAGIELRNFQDALRRQVDAFEELRRLEPSFRAVLADLERTRKELASVRAAALTAVDVIDGASRNRHSDIFAEGIAAWANREGITRDELSGAFLQVADRFKDSGQFERRGIVVAWLKVFGSTNALPALRRMALDPNDPNGWHALWPHFAIAGFSDETLSWTEPFLLDVRPERAKRRAEFLNVFRHSLDGDDLAPAERDALGRCLLRVTEAADDSPAWTDQVLCRAFPAYAGSAERRARLEAALARLPPPAPERKGALPDGTEFVRRDLTNALATAVATNPAPFSIPVPRSPPAPRVLPDAFVLPEIPQEWRE